MIGQEICSLEELDGLAEKDENYRNLIVSLARKMDSPNLNYDLCYEFLLAAVERGDEKSILEEVNFYKRLAAFNL